MKKNNISCESLLVLLCSYENTNPRKMEVAKQLLKKIKNLEKDSNDLKRIRGMLIHPIPSYPEVM